MSLQPFVSFTGCLSNIGYNTSSACWCTPSQLSDARLISLSQLVQPVANLTCRHGLRSSNSQFYAVPRTRRKLGKHAFLLLVPQRRMHFQPTYAASMTLLHLNINLRESSVYHSIWCVYMYVCMYVCMYLLSIYAVTHSCYMPAEAEMLGLDSWGEKWLAGAPLNFFTGNKLVPLGTEQPPQAPLIKSIDFPCIILGDYPTFQAMQEDW